MPLITEIPPAVLKSRHRLSSQQVNSIFGKEVIEESLEEKAARLAMVREFLKISDLFKTRSIRFIPLKGPLLSYQLYGDATYRHFRDLDIMLSPTELDGVLKIITPLGYKVSGKAWPSGQHRQLKLIYYHHNLPCINYANNTILELHWRFRNRQWIDVRQADLLIQQNLTTLDFAGRSFTVLNTEMELLYLLIHGGLHNWGRLKWLVDIHEYLNSREINTEKFSNLSELFKTGRLIYLCNVMLAEYFPRSKMLPCARSTPSYIVRLSKKRIASEQYPAPESMLTSLENLYFSFRIFPGLFYKLRLVNNIILNRRF